MGFNLPSRTNYKSSSPDLMAIASVQPRQCLRPVKGLPSSSQEVTFVQPRQCLRPVKRSPSSSQGNASVQPRQKRGFAHDALDDHVVGQFLLRFQPGEIHGLSFTLADRLHSRINVKFHHNTFSFFFKVNKSRPQGILRLVLYPLQGVLRTPLYGCCRRVLLAA